VPVFQEWNTATAGSTSVIQTYNATVDAGDGLCMMFSGKPFGASVPASSGAAFTLQSYLTSGTVANGLDVGSTVSSSFTRQATGSEDGTNTTITFTGGNTALARMARVSKQATSTWSFAGLAVADQTETGTAVNTTVSGGTIAFRAGDLVLVGVTFQGDTLTHSGQAVSLGGSLTISAITWETIDTTNTGNDCGLQVGRFVVLTGVATVSPVYTATASISGRSATAVSFLRMRETNTTRVHRKPRTPVNRPRSKLSTGSYR
jgi:hypothetical protein